MGQKTLILLCTLLVISWCSSTKAQVQQTLWAWGMNSSGQIGDGTTTNRNSPIQICSENLTCVACGDINSRNSVLKIQIDVTNYKFTTN